MCYDDNKSQESVVKMEIPTSALTALMSLAVTKATGLTSDAEYYRAELRRTEERYRAEMDRRASLNAISPKSEDAQVINPPMFAKLINLVRLGDKINSIKMAREIFGLPLKEAKELVESGWDHDKPRLGDLIKSKLENG